MSFDPPKYNTEQNPKAVKEDTSINVETLNDRAYNIPSYTQSLHHTNHTFTSNAPPGYVSEVPGNGLIGIYPNINAAPPFYPYAMPSTNPFLSDFSRNDGTASYVLNTNNYPTSGFNQSPAGIPNQTGVLVYISAEELRRRSRLNFAIFLIFAIAFIIFFIIFFKNNMELRRLVHMN